MVYNDYDVHNKNTIFRTLSFTLMYDDVKKSGTHFIHRYPLRAHAMVITCPRKSNHVSNFMIILCVLFELFHFCKDGQMDGWVKRGMIDRQTKCKHLQPDANTTFHDNFFRCC